MKFHSWTGQVDADESFWYEEGKYGTYFLNIIRLFYEQGTPAYEEVGELYRTLGLNIKTHRQGRGRGC